jgi:hypothetical protein
VNCATSTTPSTASTGVQVRTNVSQVGSAIRQIRASLYTGAAGRSVLLMSAESDAAVGQLAVMDGTLNDLLRDLAGEITGQDAAGMTTGKAAQVLLGRARGDRTLITPEVRDWLKRVVQAAEKRNEAMHAVGRDQCVRCGDATRFEHRGPPGRQVRCRRWGSFSQIP